MRERTAGEPLRTELTVNLTVSKSISRTQLISHSYWPGRKTTSGERSNEINGRRRQRRHSASATVCILYTSSSSIELCVLYSIIQLCHYIRYSLQSSPAQSCPVQSSHSLYRVYSQTADTQAGQAGDHTVE